MIQTTCPDCRGTTTCPTCNGTGLVGARSISEAILTARTAQGLSLRSVSDQTKLSISTLSRVERGGGTDWETMVTLARFYRLSLDDLAQLPMSVPSPANDPHSIKENP